jgi:hypothetical protein
MSHLLNQGKAPFCLFGALVEILLNASFVWQPQTSTKNGWRGIKNYA